MRKRRRGFSAHPDLSQAGDAELDRDRYETDLYRSFLDEDEPCFASRTAFLRGLAERHPERWAAFAANWQKQIAEDLQSEIKPSGSRKVPGGFYFFDIIHFPEYNE